MIIVNSLNESRFTLNGIQYFKNYTTRIAGNNLTIYNAYDNKDVLVPLTPFDQFQVNGSEYDTIEELQIAIIGVCYMRNTLDEGSPLEQNNIGRLISIGTVVPTWNGIGSYTFPAAANYTVDVANKLNDYQYIITANQAPVVVLANIVTDTGTISYKYLFKGGKGTWGTGGAQFEYYMLEYINQQNLTAVDVAENPATNIITLGNLPDADYLTAANSAQRNFNDAGTLNDDGNVISYYFSYTTDNVLYFVQFVGAAGSYNGTLTADDLVSSTNNTVTAEINYENVLQAGNFASISAIHKDPDTGMITEFHGSGFGSTLGEYTQKFLVDTPVGNYTITFPAATQNDNVVYESTLHEGLSSIGLQAATDNGNTTTNAISLNGGLEVTGTTTFNSSVVMNDALTIDAANFNVNGGLSAHYLKGDGTSENITSRIKITVIGTDNTSGNTTPIDSSTQIAEGMYRLQNQINENAGNAIPLSGTEEGSPITSNIEVSESVGLFHDNGTYSSNILLEDGGVVFNGVNSDGYITGFTLNQDSNFSINSDNPNSRGISADVDFTSNITALDYVQKKYVDDVAIQDLQNVTDTGTTTTNAITAGGLTIPDNTLNITGGNSNNYIKGNGTTGIFLADVRTATMGTDNTAGDTTPLSINSQIAVAIYRLQNMINANADNTIPLTGTEEGSPVTGDIEFDASTTVGLNANAGGQITFNNTDGVTVSGNAGGVTINGDVGGLVLSRVNEITHSNGDIPVDAPNGGFKYNADYSSLYTNRSLVDKEYVDNSLPSGTGFGYWDGYEVTWINGNSQQMVLGNGTISDIDTKMRAQWIGVNTGSNNPITSSTNFQEAVWSLQAQVENTIPLSGTEEGSPVDGAIEMADGAEIVINDGAFGIGRWYENGGINVHDNGNIVAISSNPTWKGVTYGADYSSNYTNRSLVDKEYVDEHAPRILHNNVTDSAVLTGTTDDTILKSFLIPAGTISDGILSFAGIFEKTGTADQVSYRVSINTTNSISGSTRIATLVPGSANHLYSYFGRELIINGSSVYGYPKYSDSNNGEQDASSSSSATLDTGADFYIIVSAALNDATDSVTQKSFKINFEKATE